MSAAPVITGTGVVCAAGLDVASVWAALADPTGRPRRGPLEDWGFDPGTVMAPKVLRRSDPASCYAVAAAAQAWAQAGAPEVAPQRRAVLVSIAHSGSTLAAEQEHRLAERGEVGVFPAFATMQIENAAAARVCQAFDARGVTRGIASACAGGTVALLEAAELVEAGRCDVAIAGGTQALLADTIRASYRNSRVFATSELERPFDVRRDGYVDTTGAAFVVVESAEHAATRGATPLARILGGAVTNDAHDMSSPTGVGAVECMQGALDASGVAPSDVGYVNAHGTGTPVNDVTEAGAVREVFGADAPPITSLKWTLGHLFAAAGAVEAVMSVCSLQEALIPGSGFDLDQDPEIELDVVAGAPRAWTPAPILSNSFGLGGQNASVVLGPV